MEDTYLASKRFLAKTSKQKKAHQRSNESNRKDLPPEPNHKQTSVSCLNLIEPQTPKVSVLPSATFPHESLEGGGMKLGRRVMTSWFSYISEGGLGKEFTGLLCQHSEIVTSAWIDFEGTKRLGPL